MPRYFATCARGLEPVLAEELLALHADAIEPGRGGVHFDGDLALLYAANLHLRTAIRILQPIHEAEVTSPDELYAEVRQIDWDLHMTSEHTLAVDANVRDSAITHSKYAALRVKDAICDRFLEREGRRPSVNVQEPMVPLNLHLSHNHMILSLDSSGDSLHRRGYRPIQTRAPLNESLAAGIILLTGYDGSTPFVDPLAGGGTLCIEAAYVALRRPPGLTRKRFGFMGWLNFDVRLWTRIRDAARTAMRPKLPHPILGYDVRRDAIEFAEANARASGIGNHVKFALGDIEQFFAPPGPPGILVANPPYGERLGADDDLRPLYRGIGDAIRRSEGWRAFIFTSRSAPWRSIGLKPKRTVPLFNGKLDCVLLEFHA